MTKKAKTPPGRFLAKKDYYRRRQAVFDAVKEARTHGSALVEWKGKLYTVLPFKDIGFDGGPDIFYVEGNRLRKGVAIPSKKTSDGSQILAGVRQHRVGGRVLAILVPAQP